MPDRIVTGYAGKALRLGLAHTRVEIDLVDDVGMTSPTSVFCHTPIELADLNRLVEILGCESSGVAEPIERFHSVFPDEVVGSVAVIAGCDLTMAGFKPSIVMIVHHVAVGACCRIIRQIARAAGVPKHVHAETTADTNTDGSSHPHAHQFPLPLSHREADSLARISSLTQPSISFQESSSPPRANAQQESFFEEGCDLTQIKSSGALFRVKNRLNPDANPGKCGGVFSAPQAMHKPQA